MDHPVTRAEKVERARHLLDISLSTLLTFRSISTPRPYRIAWCPLVTIRTFSACSFGRVNDVPDIGRGGCYLDFIVKNSAPGSAVVFDYLYQAVLEGIQKQNEISNMRRYRFMTGEGLTFGIPQGSAVVFLRARGFHQVKDVTTGATNGLFYR